jgi:Ribonuclease G/E
MSGGGDLEVFLDETPGETRGVVARDGRYTHLLIVRDDDIPQQRLGARSVGRVVEINSTLRGAFVDLGAGPPAFLTISRGDTLTQGDRVEVVVTAEPRGDKGAAVRRLGRGEGNPRLLESAPTVAEWLRKLAPWMAPLEGVAAIDAAHEAEDEAFSDHFRFPAGLDLAVQRTRALVAVDIDHAPTPGRDAGKDRARANVQGLAQAARLIRLKNWGGLIAIDLVGDGRDGEAQLKVARAAFAHEPQVAFGPISRFGLLQLSLPWTRAPIEEVLKPTVRTRAQALVRTLRRRLLTDTAAPRCVVRCAPEEAAVAAPLVARLGPRAAVLADPAVLAGQAYIEEN